MLSVNLRFFTRKIVIETVQLSKTLSNMPGLPNRTSVPPNVTMAYHQSAGPMIQSNHLWNYHNNNGSNCQQQWASNVGPTTSAAAAAAAAPVRQSFDVIARRRNPHYWTAGNGNPAVSSSAAIGGNSPLTPTPTPSPATPSPISPAYPNRPVSVETNEISIHT